MIERKGKQFKDTVQYALTDPTPSGRYSAMSGDVLTIGMVLPNGTLEKFAQYDPSSFVRSPALRAIADAPGVDR